MTTVRTKVDLLNPSSLPKGRIRAAFVDRTSDADLIAQQSIDDAQGMSDAAKFARRVRRRLGLTQLEFSQRIDVSLDTIRNWEQGKRCPTGAAKTLLKILDRAPEATLAVLM
jgi:putative transcriptional regulator